jgi:AraC family transcriptional regulator of adaptative response / DNA-3-methyladenine glycosylase II
VRFEYRLPPDYPVKEMLKVISRHPDTASERMDGNSYILAFSVGQEPQRLTVRLQPGLAECSLEGNAAEAARETAERILGLKQDPSAFETLMRSRGFGRLFEGREGLRITQTPTIFEGFIWVIVGQQVNIRFAAALRRRVTELVGVPAGDLLCLPEPSAVAALEPADLLKVQFSRQKADYLISIARQIASGDLSLHELTELGADEVKERLLRVRGLGIWSVNYLMMRSFGFPDCVPLGDTGISTGLKNFFGLDHRPDAKECDLLTQPFAPYRSLASYHLWRGFT